MIPDKKSNLRFFQKIKPAKKEIILSAIIVFVLTGLTIVNFLFVKQNNTVNTNNSQVTVDTVPEVINGSNNAANLDSTINWKKQVSATNVDQLQDGTIVEQINPEQEYVFNSLNLPEGWTAQWSYDPVDTPEESRTYISTSPGPNDKPTFIKISTGAKDTFKPSVVEPVSKPLSERALDSGKNPSAPILYNKKIYLIMRGVEAATDPNNLDTSNYTIDCFDILTYTRCSNYPGYFSSDSGDIVANSENQSINSGTKDINTAQFFTLIFDDGTYGNEGRVYFPAQKADEYGIGCVNIILAVNCGFTSLGSSPAPVSGDFPTLISGFVQKGSKFYGHANDADLPTQRIICFDMDSDGNGADNICSGYDETTLSSALTYDISQHYGKYKSNGSHLIIGDNMYWVVNYRYSVENIVTSSQSARRSVMYCFNVVTKQACPGTGANEGWSHNYGGAPVGSIALIEDHVTALLAWREPNGNEKGVCASVAIANELIYLKPTLRCFVPETGIFMPGGSGQGYPAGFQPSTWWPALPPSAPWKMSNNLLHTTNDQGQNITYIPFYSTSSEDVLASIENGATLCYNWDTQQGCDGFGYKVRYWFDINSGQSGDVGYAYDGACMWAVGNDNYIWSFGPKTGEFPCRSSNTELKLSINPNAYYCDGVNRTFSWDKIRLSKTNIYNFDTLKVTVKDAATGNPISGYEDVDMRELGYLDISSIDYEQYPQLELEVVPTVFNTSPWYGGKSPNISAILNTDNVQYCYETKPKQICDLRELVTTSGTTVVTETDTLSNSSQGDVTVRVPDNEQCYKDVKVSVSANKNQIRAGENVTYTVRVEHKGKLTLPDAATKGRIDGARIEVNIPTGLEYVSSTNGGRQEGNKVVWTSQSFEPEQVVPRQVTFRPAATTSQSAPANIIFAATTQQPVTVQASVIAGDDIFQSDNTASNNSVVLVTEEDTGVGTENPPENTDPPEEDPQEGGAQEEQEDTEGVPGIERLLPGGDSTEGASVAGQTLTPSFIRRIIPPQFSNQAENLFRLVNSSIQPIPNNVAVAIPYATIAFLIAFALIYIYQGVQEAKNRRRLIQTQKRYKRTEELRRNYVGLTSHYLNTPIAKMQTTLEYLASVNQLPQKTVESAKQRLTRLAQHAKMLLGTTESAGAEKTVTSKLQKKASMFGPGLVLPIIGVLLITVLINVLFVWADKYDTSASSIIIQSSYYTLSAMALFIAYSRFRSQKLATQATEEEIDLEKQLSQSQASFISNSSKTLENDLVELDQLAPSMANVQKGDGFINGLNSLKNAVSKLGYLNILTSHATVPTIPNQTIKELANEIINDLKANADERDITIDIVIEPGLTAVVDIDGFRQLLGSTVNNAIKFSNPASTVEVRVTRYDSNNIQMTVKDSGVGIPKEKVTNLFEPFGRATDFRQYNYEGFGLDLYMDKLIAEQCGGTIKVDSEVNKGTTVTIILPS